MPVNLIKNNDVFYAGKAFHNYGMIKPNGVFEFIHKAILHFNVQQINAFLASSKS